jgi:hypothetical protein
MNFVSRNHCVAGFLMIAVMLACAGASAQEAPVTVADDPDATAVANPDLRGQSEPIGGMGEMMGYRRPNPVKKLGIDIGLGCYTVSALIGLFYLVAVYPVQALFGSNKVEPVMLWLLLPIAGPWFAQYEDLVKDKPVWRGILIADAGLQAAGLVLGLIGAAIGDSRSSSYESRRVELRFGISGVTLTLRTL